MKAGMLVNILSILLALILSSVCSTEFMTLEEAKKQQGVEDPVVMEPIIETVDYAYYGNQTEHWHLKLRIRDAECYSARTTSTFTVFLATLDLENKLVSVYEIDSSWAIYHENSSSHIFELGYFDHAGPSVRKKLAEGEEQDTIGTCFFRGKIDCVPRADVVFIRFHSQPDDPWAIDQIDVDVYFTMQRGGRQTYHWHFEHAVLRPCSSWLKETHMYQIGPRNGLFIEREYLYMPTPGEWIRDWM